MTLGHFWPLVAEKAKKPNSEIPKKSVFWPFSASRGRKNDLDTENTKKHDLEKDFCLYLMTLGPFWPQVAEKAEKLNSDINQKIVFFGLFQPPEAENDPDTENTKELDF